MTITLQTGYEAAHNATTRRNPQVKQVEAAVIGTGWCGGIRAETLSRTALCDKLHICEIRPDRLAEVKALTKPATATLDYQDIVNNPNISVVYICTTPEQTHFPITRDCLKAGKHVLLEKPISMELWEADELITLANRANLKFTIGYSQRFNTKVAYAKKSIADGTLGKIVNVMVSRHISRSLGTKIGKRVRLSPAAMESTHDLDFVFWLLEPAKPVRIYSQGAYGFMQPINGSYDVMWSIVTMDDGTMVSIGGGWNLPPSYPNYCATWIEITGSEGSLFLDDTQRDNWLSTVSEGTRFPMSTMPGEQVDHVFAGQMGPETIHFLESCILDRPVMVRPEHARMVMETYLAADLSAEQNEPIDLPLSNQSLSAITAMTEEKKRAAVG
jgi:myo-inositol 2-dehydrogenase/D-chiro-inositol 1-dehydrogenase